MLAEAASLPLYFRMPTKDFYNKGTIASITKNYVKMLGKGFVGE